MNNRAIERISGSNEARCVTILPGHQAELTWDRVQIPMRTVDLLVLHDALRMWMERAERKWAETYVLSLNDCKLFIHHDDLYRFCAMIQAAVDEVPRRVVRWADLSVELTPCDANDPYCADALLYN